MSANNNREGEMRQTQEAAKTIDPSRINAEILRRASSDIADRYGLQLGPIPTRTLRDEFAMAALVNCSDHMANPEDMASAAYEVADAMLEARKVKPA